MLEYAQPNGERARLSETLIENALALTGKTMEDMNIPKYLGDGVVNGMAFPEFGDEFSIEKFCYYLLSPEFIEKYSEISIKLDRRNNNYKNDDDYKDSLASDFGYAIRKYQSDNKTPLITLLQKICLITTANTAKKLL